MTREEARDVLHKLRREQELRAPEPRELARDGLSREDRARMVAVAARAAANIEAIDIALAALHTSM